MTQESTSSAPLEQSEGKLMQSFETLPYQRLFDVRNATAEEWSDTTAWHREEDEWGPISVRMTSQYGEHVQQLTGGRPYGRPSPEGKRLVDAVRDRLSSAGFDTSTRDSTGDLYLKSFSENLGAGLSPTEALQKAYGGEYWGTGESEYRAMWPDQWPKGRKKPQQWDFEDLLGINRM